MSNSGNNHEKRLGPNMNDPFEKIKLCAAENNRQELIALFEQAKVTTETDFAQALLFESVRLQSLSYFDKAKGKISNLHEIRPVIRGIYTTGELQSYEDFIKEFLRIHNNKIDSIIERHEPDKDQAAIKSIDKLKKIIEAIPEDVKDSPILTSLTNLKSPKIPTEQLRHAVASSGSGITESLWSVNVASREARIDLLEALTPFESVRFDFESESNKAFTNAADIATDATINLANLGNHRVE